MTDEERVARALCIADFNDPDADVAFDNDYGPQWNRYRRQALTALDAMTHNEQDVEHFINPSIDHSSQTCNCGKRDCPALRPTVADDYTPSMKELRQAWEAVQLGQPTARAEFDRAIANHDAELRAEIAAEIRALIDQGYLDASTVGATKRKYLERAATIAEGTAYTETTTNETKED